MLKGHPRFIRGPETATDSGGATEQSSPARRSWIASCSGPLRSSPKGVGFIEDCIGLYRSNHSELNVNSKRGPGKAIDKLVTQLGSIKVAVG